ncbi:MAG: RNA polymerase sigma factor [Lachnospiraceae bacterium]
MLLFTMMENDSFEEREKRDYSIEEALINRIGEEDAEAFKELYHMHARTIYAYALSILKNHHDAEEVMQDTFLKIRSGAHLYQSMGKPLAWIFKIAKNFCLMKIRKNSHQSDYEFKEIENSSLLSYEMDPEDRIVLKAALDLLTSEERSIILLHAVSGLKHREIAENLGKPLSTVLSRYHRGIKKLRIFLQEREEETDGRKKN